MPENNNQKIENLLNLALDATEEEREKSLELNVGFDTETNTWDIIVRHSGNIDFLREYDGVTVVNLNDNYAILTVPENIIDDIADLPEIIFVEKPKLLYFTVLDGRRVSCISPVQDIGYEGTVTLPNGDVVRGLFGQGVIIGIIDSGIDYMNDVFRNEDGTTRILELWDQTVGENPPAGYRIGSVYTREDINRAINAATPSERYAIVPSRDTSAHGTYVAGIAAGNYAENRNNNLGIATQSELIIVKLGNPRTGSFPRTVELMEAIDYVIKRAAFYGRPLALNLSFGNNYGSHDGTSLLETFIDDMADSRLVSIAVGTGNEGTAGVHTSNRLLQGETHNVEFSVSQYEASLNIQIWKQYEDDFTIEIIAPNGASTGIFNSDAESARYRMDGVGTELLVYYGRPKPYSRFQEIYIDFIPDMYYVDSGIWTIRLASQNIVVGEYDMWMPSSGVLNNQTGFLTPTPDTTLTIPSTASGVISVGAYNSNNFSVADFSGRGYTRLTNQIKPDIVAPGVNIATSAPGNLTSIQSGTSMAAPFVTGALALLMEWGIFLGNDRFMYGEKAKAYLIKGAKNPWGSAVTPNPQTGFGALCLRDSFPL